MFYINIVKPAILYNIFLWDLEMIYKKTVFIDVQEGYILKSKKMVDKG